MSDKKKVLWWPQYWPTWAAMAVARLIVFLPYAWQMFIGRRIGDVAHLLIASRRHVVDVNLRMSFPEWDEDTHRRKVREHFQSAGMGLVETFICWWASDHFVQRLAHYEGLEHLQDALAQGRGVILLSAHFTSLELGVRMSSLQASVTAMYRPPNNPVIDHIMRSSRERIVGKDVIPKSEIRGLLRALRKGEAVWYAPDQSASRKLGAEIPFFGQPAITHLATSRLAKMSKAPVVPFFTLRRQDGSGYRVIVQPALKDFPSEDETADALRVNQIIEAQVREAPTQYFWLHKRFKLRKKKNVYSKK